MGRELVIVFINVMEREAPSHQAKYRLALRKLVLIEINSALHSNTYPYSLNSLIHFSVSFVHSG